MENPEYTERAINEALSAHGISVVWDHGHRFEIVESVDSRHYVSIDDATSYDDLAAKLVANIDRLGEDA